jgi:SAM-dependent methyltransferase
VSSAGYDREAFELTARLEEGHYWFEARNELITWALDRWFPSAETYLEIGCGTGYVLAAVHRHARHLELTGSDLYPEGLEFARERVPAAEFEQLDATDLPHESRFDVIGAYDVLEHIPDDEAALASVHRALRPGGGLILTVPQHPWLWGPSDEYAHHQRRYTREELVGKLRGAGFEIERLTSFISLPLPAMAATRVLDRRRGSEAYDFESELRVGPVANRVLTRTLAAERSLIKRGRSFPAGGSLFAVARRP